MDEDFFILNVYNQNYQIAASTNHFPRIKQARSQGPLTVLVIECGLVISLDFIHINRFFQIST